MHPAVPEGCELIARMLHVVRPLFFSWDHAFESVREIISCYADKPEDYRIEELPPRFDFFEKHESQK